MATYKLYNYQVVTIGYRSEIVEIDDEDIQMLREWKEKPYKGETDQDLLDYIKSYTDEASYETYDETPYCLIEIYKNLIDCPERTEIWNSLQKSGDSKIILEDEENDFLAEVDSSM